MSSPEEHRRVRLKQAAVIALGIVLAAVMGGLGVWQASRATQVGDGAIAARASESPRPLLDWVHPDGTTGDIYGKPVTVSGAYLPDEQIMVVGDDGTHRVLTALQITDGRVVPVVRGTTPSDALPTPPVGPQTATGIFLPGEGDAATVVKAGQLASVRMPLLAQRWPQQITPGFVTLDAAGAAANGLQPASVTLPHGEQSLQNGSYAIQWWVFAAFALILCGRFAYSFGEKERQRDEAALAAAQDRDASTAPADPPSDEDSATR